MAKESDSSSAWERYWFAPRPIGEMTRGRAALCTITVLYFLSHLADAGWWFARDGVLDPQTTALLMGVGSEDSVAQYRFSPLYLIGSATGLRIALLIFACIAAAAAVFGTRLLVGLVYLSLLSVIHRGPMLAGLLEIPLCFGLLYCLIQPGWSLRRGGDAGSVDSWTTTLARRLIGLHTAALLLMTAATQLASDSWWAGEAAAYLALDSQARGFSLLPLIQGPLVSAAVTHLLVILPLVGVALWAGASHPRHGKYILFVYLAAIALLTSEVLYATTLGALVMVGLPGAGMPRRDAA